MSGQRSEDGGEAAWIPLVPPPEAEGELARTYESLGYRRVVDHVVGIHSLHPEAMEAHLGLYRTLMFGASPLSRAQREGIAVVVSSLNDCFY